MIFKTANLEELRNNLIDIWARFPNELCEKIVGEFDDKIRICQKEEGKILNKILLNQYSYKKRKINKNNNDRNYDWETIKREKNFRIVYNDKIIEIVKRKLLNSVYKKSKEKIKEYRKKHPKVNAKNKSPEKLPYQTYNKKIEKNVKTLNKFYKRLIKFIKQSSSINIINNFINKDFIKDKKVS